jgi:hypothetical protein
MMESYQHYFNEFQASTTEVEEKKENYCLRGTCYLLDITQVSSTPTFKSNKIRKTYQVGMKIRIVNHITREWMRQLSCQMTFS